MSEDYSLKFRQQIADALRSKLLPLGVAESAIPAFAAQIALETTDKGLPGNSRNFVRRNNVAGIRGFPVTPDNTRGYVIYESLDDGLNAYVDLIKRKYPTFLQAGQTGDPYAVAAAMGASPWAATRYRLNADGTNDKAGDAGVVLGDIGTEGQELFPHIARVQQALELQAARGPRAADRVDKNQGKVVPRAKGKRK